MATIDELLEIIKIQQKTIETLTAKLEKANDRIAELEEQLHKNSITAANHRLQMDMILITI